MRWLDGITDLMDVATLESIQKGNLVSQPAQEVFLQASQLF